MSETLDPAATRKAQEMARELAGRWACAPYFRSADGVSYTPRRQLRGFLATATHPLGQAMLRYLFELALLVEPSEFRSLFAHAQEALPAEAGRLAQTLRHLSRTHAEALEQVRTPVGWEALREQLMVEDGTAPPSRLEEAFRTWQERWLSAGA